MLQPDNNTTATTLTKTVQEGRVSSCPPDPGQSLLKAFEVSEIVPAALGVSYTVHVRADTIAGSSAADPVYICKCVYICMVCIFVSRCLCTIVQATHFTEYIQQFLNQQVNCTH